MTDSPTPSSLLDDALAIWRAGVEAVRPETLVAQHVRFVPEGLEIGDHLFPRRGGGRLMVVGGGKAAASMAAGLEAVLEAGNESGFPEWSGWVNVPEGTERALRQITADPARPAGCNEPTPRAVEGARRMMEMVESARPEDCCLVLLSGGGSALLPLPVDAITLEDKREVTRHLSGGGATIEQLNAVRRCLSAIKAGGLARRCRAGHLITLIISDVLGDPLEVIASGPTVLQQPDPRAALAVLAQYDPDRQLPAAIYRYLESPAADPSRWPAATTQLHTQVIGNNAVAVDGAGVEAERRGYAHAMQSAVASEGTAEEVGRHLAEMAVEMLHTPGPDCLISGGEPVVRLVPEAERGRGGRNQQLVLAALLHLATHPRLSDAQRRRITLLSGGTDGEDGPTDAAGAWLDRRTWEALDRGGVDPAEALRRNDAYTFFAAAGGLLKTGPTGTNVCDLRVITVAREP